MRFLRASVDAVFQPLSKTHPARKECTVAPSTSSRRQAAVKVRKFDYKPALKFAPAVIGFVLPLIIYYVSPFSGLSQTGHYCLAIFLAAAALWIFEPVPLYATAVLIFFLQLIMLSDKAIIKFFTGAPVEGAMKYQTLLYPLADPLVILFLGGFALADASRKYGVDRDLARVLLKPFGTKPKFILLGVMLITASFSAFMSNTACTAMMMAVIFPAMAVLGANDKFKIALTLSVPFAANIGGMATPIGTPPNAVAIAALSKLGKTVSFFDWVELALPFTVVMLGLTWFLLTTMFPGESKEINLKFAPQANRGFKTKFVYIIFGATVLLWITGKWHGIPDGVVALLPVTAFAMMNILSPKEFNSLSWDILWLIAGGMALGNAMEATKLTEWLVGVAHFSAMPSWLVLVSLALATVLLSTFMSNTAAANLFIPLGVGVAVSGGLNSIETVVALGLSASLAMALPISTPPNAIAYSSGTVSAKNMTMAGAVVGVIGLLILLTGTRLLWSAMGAF